MTQPSPAVEPATRARLGATSLVLLLPSAFLAVIASGPIRALTGLSMSASLPVALVLSVAVALLFRRPVVAPLWSRREVWAISAIGAVGLETLLIILLYNQNLYGMVNTEVGVDTSNHVVLFERFADWIPDPYFGFVSHFAVVYWFGALFKTKLFASFRFLFYFSISVLPIAMTVPIAAAFGDTRLDRRGRIALAFSATAALGLLALVVFPLVSYHQSDGFLSHLFGLYPFALLFVAYGVLDDPRQRLIATVVLVAAQRYSYGENLGDLLIACVLVWAGDVFGGRLARRWRVGFFLTAPLALAVAAAAITKIWLVRDRDGFFSFYGYSWILPVQLLTGFLLVEGKSVLGALGIAVDDTLERFLRFAGVFGLVNGLVQVGYLAIDGPVKYYFYKYGLFGQLIVGIGALGLFARVAAHVAASGSLPLSRRARWWTAAALLLAVGATVRGLAIYYPAAWERAVGRPPFSNLYSYYDGAADRMIDEVLQSTNKTFGGYFDPFWPRAQFMNVVRGKMSKEDYLDRAYRYYNVANLFPAQPNECYFWYGPLDPYRKQKLPQLAELEWLMRRSNVECRKYHRRWEEKSDGQLCYVCL